jgi:hypothetical protein
VVDPLTDDSENLDRDCEYISAKGSVFRGVENAFATHPDLFNSDLAELGSQDLSRIRVEHNEVGQFSALEATDLVVRMALLGRVEGHRLKRRCHRDQ